MYFLKTRKNKDLLIVLILLYMMGSLLVCLIMCLSSALAMKFKIRSFRSKLEVKLIRDESKVPCGDFGH